MTLLADKKSYKEHIRKINKLLPRGWKKEFMRIYYSSLAEKDQRIYMNRLNNFIGGYSRTAGLDYGFIKNLKHFLILKNISYEQLNA